MHSYSPHKRNKKYYYWIDVVGTCNLRCPTCAVGNFQPSEFARDVNPTGFMDVEIYRQIIEKIKADDVSDRTEIHLYNWGEPLLHPRIAEIVAITKAAGYYCGLSSNLNLDKNLKDVIKANPDFFRISVSGFYQENYQRTHRRGNILTVKSNMYKLRRYLDAYKADTTVQVLYHVYRHNAGEDLTMMVKLCDELGFYLEPVWAYFMPVEKGIKLLQGQVSENDSQVLDMLAIDPRITMKLAEPFKKQDCTLRKSQTSINYDGSVQLCCGTYDHAHSIAPAFLQSNQDELQASKYKAAICGPCMDAGMHVVLTYGVGEQLDQIGNEALQADNAKFKFNQFSEPHLTYLDGSQAEVYLPTPPVKKQIRGLRKYLKFLR